MSLMILIYCKDGLVAGSLISKTMNLTIDFQN